MPVDLSMVLDLLDDQIVDADGLPIGRVDDVEIDLEHPAGPQVTELVVGAAALGLRLGGLRGLLMQSVAERLRSREQPPGPPVVDAGLITELRPLVRLRVGIAELPAVAGLERWLSHNLVQRLPGSGHARQ